MDNFCWVAYGPEHIEMAQRSMDTVRKHYPDAKFWLIAEKYIPQLSLMQQMTADQARVLNEIQLGETVCFLDNDALLLKPFEMDNDEFDVAVTWRDNMGDLSMLMPYNYGVVFARKTYNSMAAWFWMVQHVGRQNKKNQKWYGNQVALRELCGPINYKQGELTVRSHGYFSVKVAHYPCDLYNWTPEEVEDTEGKYIVHCKGNRKDLLDHYYSAIMEAA